VVDFFILESPDSLYRNVAILKSETRKAVIRYSEAGAVAPIQQGERPWSFL